MCVEPRYPLETTQMNPGKVPHLRPPGLSRALRGKPRWRGLPVIISAMCAAATAQEPLRLSLREAVGIATAPDGAARVQLAREAVQQANSRAAQARGALLPNVEGSIAQQNMTRNLEAFGIRIESPIPGFRVPAFVGPFSVFDARATVTQSVLDFSAIRRYQASRTGARAAGAESDAAADFVAWHVARSYVAALRADADVEAAAANVALAEAVVKLAESQKNAGTGTGIEVTRARVQLSNERQRQLVLENERRRAQLQLVRAMGAPLDTPVVLTESLGYAAADRIVREQALETAARSRRDVQAQQEREASARLSAAAAKYERLPSLAAFADYGSIGSSVTNALPTRMYGLTLRVPVFDGGRRDARRAEAASQYRQEQTRTRDLRDQVSLDVRLALDALESAEAQVKVAEEGLALAENELAQARRRYEAGVTTSLEVTDAQTRLARARDNRIAALFGHSVARMDFGHATGTLFATLGLARPAPSTGAKTK